MYLLVTHERTSVWSLKTSGRKGLGRVERVWLQLKAFHYTAVLMFCLLPISMNGAHASCKCTCTET